MKKIYLFIITVSFSFYAANAQKPVANFGESQDTICGFNCITFSDSSSNNPTSWYWTFIGGSPATSSDKNPFVCYSDVGKYDVKLVVANSFGSDSITKTALIVVNPTPPTPNMILDDDTLFVTTDTSYTSYQWYHQDTLIVGATDTFLVISPKTCDDYNVLVCNRYNCCIAVGINIICEGVNNLLNEKEIIVFPNPSTDELTIHSSLLSDDDDVTIYIMNVLGEIMLEEKWRDDVIINIETLPKGIYILELKTQSQNVVKRFVKG